MEIILKKDEHYRVVIAGSNPVRRAGGRFYCLHGHMDAELSYEQINQGEKIHCSGCSHICKTTNVKAFDYFTLILEITNNQKAR